MTQVDLTDEQIAALNAMAQAPAPTTTTDTPVTQTPETTQDISDIQPTQDHVETIPATGVTLVDPQPEHPALTKIQEIEEHLGLLSMYGSVEQKLRNLVAELKAFFA